jgi:hypothetical protein
MEMSIGLKRIYRIGISIILSVLGWMLCAKFLVYISFYEFFSIELLVALMAIVGSQVKKEFGLDINKEDDGS